MNLNPKQLAELLKRIGITPVNRIPVKKIISKPKSKDNSKFFLSKTTG